MPTLKHEPHIKESVELTNKSCDSIAAQIRDPKNRVAFKTPRVSKKTPSLIFQ
jgi:hypothetical protein